MTTPEFNNLRSENFAKSIKQANWATKSDIANSVTQTGSKIVVWKLYKIGKTIGNIW